MHGLHRLLKQYNLCDGDDGASFKSTMHSQAEIITKRSKPRSLHSVHVHVIHVHVYIMYTVEEEGIR